MQDESTKAVDCWLRLMRHSQILLNRNQVCPVVTSRVLNHRHKKQMWGTKFKYIFTAEELVALSNQVPTSRTQVFQVWYELQLLLKTPGGVCVASANSKVGCRIAVGGFCGSVM